MLAEEGDCKLEQRAERSLTRSWLVFNQYRTIYCKRFMHNNIFSVSGALVLVLTSSQPCSQDLWLLLPRCSRSLTPQTCAPFQDSFAQIFYIITGVDIFCRILYWQTKAQFKPQKGILSSTEDKHVIFLSCHIRRFHQVNTLSWEQNLWSSGLVTPVYQDPGGSHSFLLVNHISPQ